jgi:anti-sigma-K factor RskA
LNISEYIQSGIVESYVLGLASAEEKAEFERMCTTYPDVLQARINFEQQLEEQAIATAITPPSNIKTQIFDKLTQQHLLSVKNTTEANYTTYNNDATGNTPVKQLNWQKYIAAASVILLVGSALLNFYFYNQYRNYITRYNNLLAQQTQLASDNKIQQTKLQQYQNTFNQMKDPAMKVVKMPAVAAGANELCTVYWHTSTKDVYLMVNNLTQPAADKQYQLWAIVDGKPVDAGVFNLNNTNNALVKMKNIPNAQAFAVTLEKKGGSPTPNLQALQVMGKV